MSVEQIGLGTQMTMLGEAHQIATGILDIQDVTAASREAIRAQEIALLEDAFSLSSVAPPDEIQREGNIESEEPAILPYLLERVVPVEEDSEAAITTELARTAIGDIILGDDDRVVVIVGPCSIHSAEQAIAYAEKVKGWREKYGDQLEIIMRVYPEKPRSELGWKGMAYDPRLDGSDDISLGLTLARMTARHIAETGVPVAMERLHALTPLYMDKLVAYDAIGARNVVDQRAREYASGTAAPVGMKNGPDGSIDDAISAVVAARNKHTFLGMGKDGMPKRVRTAGNKLAHIILRGGKTGPNYSPEHIAEAKAKLAAKSGEIGEILPEAIIVDASHGNSGKKAKNQRLVVESLAQQVSEGEQAIKGVMLESSLVAGKQDLGDGNNLEYGKSVTDDCIDIDETDMLLDILATSVETRRSLSLVS